MTPEERSRALRRLGYREPIDNTHLAGSIATVLLSLIGFGASGLVLGEPGGDRLQALVMLLIGVALAIPAGRWILRPAATLRDADLARELRHRTLREQEEEQERKHR